MDQQRTLPSWAKEFVEQDIAGGTASQRVAALVQIGKLAEEGSWHEIDAAISNVPVANVSDRALMTFLRGTFRFKHRLSEWHGLRERVEAEFKNRNVDTARLLIGI